MARNSTEPKPTHVTICEISEIAYSQAEALVLQGWSFDKNNLPEHYLTGTVSIHMVLTASAAK